MNIQKTSIKSFQYLPWLLTVGVCALTIFASLPMLRWVEPTNIAMLFLLVVLGVSFWWGRGAGVLSAFLMVAGFDFFFVEPHLSFAVSDAQYLITFAVMLVVAIFISNLVSQLRRKQMVTEQQASQTAALYSFSKDLMRALNLNEVAQITTGFVRQHLGFSTCVLSASPNEPTRLVAVNSEIPLKMVETIAAESLYQQNTTHNDAHTDEHTEGYFEDEGQSSMYVLLQGSTRARGVLLVHAMGHKFQVMRDARPILDAVASMVAIAIERLHYIEVANQHQWQMESERLRGSILAALSHDIRTPLTAMYGVADGLHWLEPKPAAQVLDAADKLCEQTLQLNRMVGNLLDFSKLHAGQVRLQREWVPLDEVIGSSLRALVQPLHDVRVDVNVPASLSELLLYLDPVLFERVLANLLDNAIKYNASTLKEKIIAIDAQVQQSGTERDCVIRVINPAQHLSERQISEMFTLFERLGIERTELGTGLGLSICRTIVTAHEGQIWAENTQMNGQDALAVCVRLPVGTPPEWHEESAS
ncbi:MAG: kdpD [Burkholderiaceae bacterium]|nr:kdpD [Burkholderiaceae bacterium]